MNVRMPTYKTYALSSLDPSKPFLYFGDLYIKINKQSSLAIPDIPEDKILALDVIRGTIAAFDQTSRINCVDAAVVVEKIL